MHEPKLILHFLSSYWILLLQDPIQDITLHLILMSPEASLGYGNFVNFPCVLMALFWGLLAKYFVGCHLLEFVWWVFFPDYTEVIGFGEEDHRVSFSSYDIKDKCYQHVLWLLTLTLITWLGWCLPGVSSVKSLPIPFSLLYSLVGSHYM